MASRFDSLEDYLASLDLTKAKTIRAVIESILEQFPELEVKISWNVPQVHRNGQYVFGISALKSHLALAPWSARVIEEFRARLERYVVRKNLFQISVDWEIDAGLLKDLVRARLAELDESSSGFESSRSSRHL
jgi:uncharacterized protein